MAEVVLVEGADGCCYCWKFESCSDFGIDFCAYGDFGDYQNKVIALMFYSLDQALDLELWGCPEGFLLTQANPCCTEDSEPIDECEHNKFCDISEKNICGVYD